MSLPQTFVKDENFNIAPDELVSNIIVIETNPYTEPTVFAAGIIQPDESVELLYSEFTFGFGGIRGREVIDRVDDYDQNI